MATRTQLFFFLLAIFDKLYKLLKIQSNDLNQKLNAGLVI
jgi:hypothetical protein